MITKNITDELLDLNIGDYCSVLTLTENYKFLACRNKILQDQELYNIMHEIDKTIKELKNNNERLYKIIKKLKGDL